MDTRARNGLLQSLLDGSCSCSDPKLLLSQEAWLRREALWAAALDWCLRSGRSLEAECRSEHLEAVGWELRIRATLQEIGQAADRRGIQILAFKGCALSLRYYLHPGQRSYGDIDLAVRSEDRAGFEELLFELHFSPPVGTAYYREGLALDLHTHPLHQLGLDLCLGNEPWWQNLERLPCEYGALSVLRPEQEFILALFHGAKHAFSRGNWVADLWLLSRRQDPKALAEAVTRRRAGRHLWLAQQCLRAWFGADFPVEVQRSGKPAHRFDAFSHALLSLILKRQAPDFLGMLTPLWALKGVKARWSYFWRALSPAPGEHLAQKMRRLVTALVDIHPDELPGSK
ncbi:nucleotidyltransferase family protein [bacterium]|nr:nucleotidyltransferase family protein [bacterium]